VIRYAALGVAWSTLLAIAAGVATAMALVALWPATMWPLEGTAIGLLAAGAAWSMDETAAAVVDAGPRSLAWRVVARASGPALLAAVWAGCLALARTRLPPHTGFFALQGAVALLASTTLATLLRARGRAAPGTSIASAVLPLAAFLALVRPAERQLPIFPVWSGEDWRLASFLWLGLALCATVLLMSLAMQRR
jgi:hypothetical protein